MTLYDIDLEELKEKSNAITTTVNIVQWLREMPDFDLLTETLRETKESLLHLNLAFLDVIERRIIADRIEELEEKFNDGTKG